MGLSAEEVTARLAALRSRDLPTHGGRTLAYVYDSGLAEADEVGRRALAAYAASNGLDPTAFPSLMEMENDLVGLAADLVDGPDTTVGSVTSGGTESCLLAVQTARDGRGDVHRPRMVLSSTTHAAFLKAAHYFQVEPVVVEVDPVTHRADPEAIRAAVAQDVDRTVLVVVSAPSYAHGVIDPVPEVAALAAEHGIRCHVDACIGGWVLPFLEDVPPWSFAVDGVTSISVDLHKYAYTPKGVSVLLHRSPQLRRPQFFASADWPGYTMLNSTMQSTKSGGPLAAAWAVAGYIGRDGYAALARQAREGTLAVVDALRGVPELSLAAVPDSTLVAFATDGSCDVFTISDEMLARGWYVQPQMAFRGDPPTLHLTMSAATAPSVPAFTHDMRAAVAAAVEAGPVEVDPELRAAAASLDVDALDDAAFDGLLQLAGLADASGGLALPERMAPVNALLDVAPPRLREALMVAFLDRLTRPHRAASDGLG